MIRVLRCFPQRPFERIKRKKLPKQPNSYNATAQIPDQVADQDTNPVFVASHSYDILHDFRDHAVSLSHLCFRAIVQSTWCSTPRSVRPHCDQDSPCFPEEGRLRLLLLALPATPLTLVTPRAMLHRAPGPHLSRSNGMLDTLLPQYQTNNGVHCEHRVPFRQQHPKLQVKYKQLVGASRDNKGVSMVIAHGAATHSVNASTKARMRDVVSGCTTMLHMLLSTARFSHRRWLQQAL